MGKQQQLLRCPRTAAAVVAVRDFILSPLDPLLLMATRLSIFTLAGKQTAKSQVVDGELRSTKAIALAGLCGFCCS